MKVLWAILGLILLGSAVYSWNTLNSPVSSLQQGSISAKLYQRGFYKVGEYEIAIKDTQRESTDSKATQKMGRNISGKLWFPAVEEGFVAPGKHPIYLHIPQYLETASQLTNTASILASKGYIVISIDPAKSSKPAISTWAAIANTGDQIEDVRFLLDTLEEWNQSPDTPFYSRLAFDKLSISAFSTASISAQLLLFHPELRDQRIKAAILVAPISHIFNAELLSNDSDTPILVVATNTDAVSHYESNAVYIAANHKSTWLINIKDGAHHQFSEPLNTLGSWFNNRRVQCEDLAAATKIDKSNSALSSLITRYPEIFTSNEQLPCQAELADPMPAIRQRELTTLALQAFVESHFAMTEIERDNALNFMTETLIKEHSDISVFPPITIVD